MFRYLPTEICAIIAQLLPLRDRASLARCSKELHQLCSRITFKHDIERSGASSTFYAIALCRDEETSLAILQAASRCGAKFEHCRDLRDRRLALCSTQFVYHCPLLLAAECGRTGIVKFLLDQDLPVDGPEGFRVTPLFLAIRHQKFETARALVEHGAVLNPPQLNMNALQYAVWYAVPYLVVYLVGHHNGDITQPTRSGECCLKLALASPRPAEMTNLVLELGYDVSVVIAQCCAEAQWELLLRLFRLTFRRLQHILPLGHCLACIESVSLRKAPKSEEHNQSMVLRYLLLISVSAATGKHQTNTLFQAEVFLEEVLARTLSVDNARLSAAEVLLQHNVRVRQETIDEVLNIAKSQDFAQDSRLVIGRHKHLLKIMNFLLECCSWEKMGNAMTNKFYGDLPTYAHALLRDMKRCKVPLTVYGLDKLVRLQAIC